MKKILGVYSPPRPHWVGDGFPVRTLFSYDGFGQRISPFLLLDYGGPYDFKPIDPASDRKRGVGQHPHRGFETVTIVYQGEVEHRDSTGAGGIIGPGDVQWMTAAGGIVHEEFHSPAFAQKGGTFEMVQLWVNLPASDKMADPRYQTLLNADIPSVALPDNAGHVRVIAGDYDGHLGPAQTFTPINVWDVRMTQNGVTRFDVPDGHTLALVVLTGTIMVNGTEIARAGQFVQLDRDDSGVVIEANNDVTLLLLSGEPIDEPIVGRGPFVMNSQEEIIKAIEDFNSGQFGQVTRH